MARRSRRYVRSSPDMGWVVGTGTLQVTQGSGDRNTVSDALFDFADIDPEATTGRIEADKSDWFIKRAIFHMVGVASLDGINPTDTSRMLTWGLSTANTLNTEEVVDADLAIFGPEWYNLQARIFRTGVMPVYHAPVLPYGTDVNVPAVGLMTTELSNPNTEPVGWVAAFPMWGPAIVHEDVAISNAGLRNNQSVQLTISTFDVGTEYDWQFLDAAQVGYTYQFLMQKRRA